MQEDRVKCAQDVETKIGIIRDAITSGYNWKIIQTTDEYKWELTKSPFIVHIGIHRSDVWAYEHAYREANPDWKQKVRWWQEHPEPLTEIISPWGRLVGISGASGYTRGGSPDIDACLKQMKIDEALKPYRVDTCAS
jgi:hypothetical protein